MATGQNGKFETQITALREALEVKVAELDLREQQIEIREKEVARILKRIPDDQANPITVLIGGRQFYTSDAVLTSKATLLAAMVANPDKKFRGVRDGVLMIPRDGGVFHFILEYLQYGEIITKPSPEELRKLEREAEFFCMPQGFLQETKKNPSVFQLSAKPAHIIELGSTNCSAAGLWSFNVKTYVPETQEFYEFNGNNSVTVKVAGIYHLIARGCFYTNAGNLYFELVVGGNGIGRHTVSPNSQYVSGEINTIRFIPAGSKVEVHNSTIIALYGDALQNQLVIFKLE